MRNRSCPNQNKWHTTEMLLPAAFWGVTLTPMHTLQRLLRDDSGQDLIEYALIAALIAIAAIAAMKALSTKISAEFNTIGSSL